MQASFIISIIMGCVIVHHVAMGTTEDPIIDQHISLSTTVTEDTIEAGREVTIPAVDVTVTTEATVSDIQSETCHNFSLYSTNLKTVNENNVHDSLQQPCSHICICDATCYGNRTCCLYFHGHMNESITEFGTEPNGRNSGELTNGRSAKSNERRSVSVDNNFHVYEEIRLRNECVWQQMFVEIKFPTFEDGKAFSMVASCKTNLKGSRLHALCEERGQNYIDLPVTSSLSNITYADVHCMFCNENNVKNGDYFVWKLILFCKTLTPKEMSAVRSVSELYNMYKNTSKDGSCNIRYLPRKEIITSLNECIHYDITSCNITGAWSEFNETLDRACLLASVSPVRASVPEYKSERELTYKNIACYLCNTGNFSRIFQQCPKAKGKHWTGLQLITSVELLGDVTSPETIPGSKQLPLLLPRGMSNGRKCAGGYFFDVHKNQCRQLHCPKDHINVQRICVPVYGTLNGTYFHIPIGMRILKKISWSQATRYRHSVSEAFLDFLTNNKFSSCWRASSVWMKVDYQNNVKYLHYELFFRLTTRKASFHDVLSKLDAILQTTDIFGTIFDEERKLPPLVYDVFLNDGVILSKTLPLTYVDIKDGKELIPFTKFRPLSPHLCGMVIKITATSFCASVELSSEEFVVKNGKLRVHNQVFVGREFEVTSDGRAFVCVERYNTGGMPATVVDNKVHETGESQNPADANKFFIIGCLSVTAAIVVLFISVRVYKNLLHKSRNRSSPEPCDS